MNEWGGLIPNVLPIFGLKNCGIVLNRCEGASPIYLIHAVQTIADYERRSPRKSLLKKLTSDCFCFLQKMKSGLMQIYTLQQPR